MTTIAYCTLYSHPEILFSYLSLNKTRFFIVFSTKYFFKTSYNHYNVTERYFHQSV